MKLSEIKPYAKAIVAAGGVVVIVGKALLDGSFSNGELIEMITAILVAFGVYEIPNESQK